MNEPAVYPNNLGYNRLIVPAAGTRRFRRNLSLPSIKMIFEGYNVHCSLVASRKDHDDMLNFAAAQGIKPAIEEFVMDAEGWKEAFEKLTSGKVRYRAVLVNELKS